MQFHKHTKTWLLTIAVGILSGCAEFLDINVDLRNPSKVGVAELLTAGEVAMVNSLGIGSDGLSTPVSILVHQTVQRGSVDAYNVTGEDFQIRAAWQNLYSGALEDFDVIVTQGSEEGNLMYVGIARILTAYTYSMMVDMWGDIPFSEALQGNEVQFPKYDDDADIYPQLIDMIDQGIADLASGEGAVPGPDDVIYGGDRDSWRRFAKTLKLKMFNQVRLVQDVSSEVNALIAEDDLMVPGGDFELRYGRSVSPDDRNPAFVVEYTPGNRLTYVSPYFYEIMTGKSALNNVLSGISDPRVPYYWFNQLTDPANAQNPPEYTDTNGFLSIWFASQGVNQSWQQDRSQTVLGLYPIGGRYDDRQGGEVGLSGSLSGPGDVAQKLLPYFSVGYIKAELMLDEGGVTGDARGEFELAMFASFEKVNAIADDASVSQIPDAAMVSYVEDVLERYDGANGRGKLELILTQKWIASFGFALDAYTDYRRTGFPVMFDPNSDPLPYTVTSRGYPVSLAYNSRSLTLNRNAPKTPKSVTADRVFWDPN